jgi:hypothetical protein
MIPVSVLCLKKSNLKKNNSSAKCIFNYNETNIIVFINIDRIKGG